MNKSTYHEEWQENRLKFILSNFKPDFFYNKKILELGAFNGFFSNYFESIGSHVFIYEGRHENVNNIKNTYPNLKNVYQKDLDVSDWNLGEFDIIINFGLYYHFEKNHKNHLINCIKNCNLLFFETVIYDSFDDEIYYRNEEGLDQSLSNVGGTPTTTFVENIFKSSEVNYTKYANKELNGGTHHYDWIDSDSKKYDEFSRRFWIVNKNNL